MSRTVNGVTYSNGDILNTKNGNICLIDISNTKFCKFVFIDTGTESVSQLSHIVNGKVSDFMRRTVHGVGYLGKNFKNEGVAIDKLRSSVVWRCMIKRCYNPNARDKVSYAGCSVDPVWHSYSNFKDWYDKNYPNDGKTYHLDKDRKVKGNKVYSPDTCIFLIASENCRHGREKEYNLVSPDGNRIKVINMSKFCSDNGIGLLSMRRLVSGKYKSHKGWMIDN